MTKRKVKTISAEEFDRKFDKGEDISDYVDWKSARVVTPFQRINLDLPPLVISKVDFEATRIGVTRTSLIKMWISERVDKLPPPQIISREAKK